MDVKNEDYLCKKQFRSNGNQVVFTLTAITQTIFTMVSISISILMMVTLEAIEYTDRNRVILAGILLISIIALYVLFGYLQKILRNKYLKKALTQFKQYIFKGILNKSINQFGVSKSGKILNAFSNDLNSIELHYLDGTLQIIQQVIMFVVSVIVMLYLNWILALCVLLACIIPVSLSVIFGRKLAEKERKISDEGESFVDQVKDLLNGFIVIKCFQAEKEILSLFEKQNLSLEEVKRDRRDTNDAVTLASTFSTILVISVIFTVGLVMAYQGFMSIGEIIAFTELSHYATGPLEKIFPLYNNRKAANALITKIADVITVEEDNILKTDIKEIKQSIRLENVEFSYDEEKEVLNKINLTFEKGKSYAIVGGSGSGKTTLIQLLQGYYSNYKGSIYYDNKELRDINLDSLYELISIIQQNVFVFDSTIKDNVTMFKSFDEQKVMKAIELAGLPKMIKEKGMNYSCGEGGRNLSGGEKQRISIARSLLRNVPVLIMDEATSALDTKTSYEVEKSIIDLKGHTKIVITHKLNETLLKNYDKIIVMRNGSVVENGTFDELMEHKDYFYALCKAW